MLCLAKNLELSTNSGLGRRSSNFLITFCRLSLSTRKSDLRSRNVNGYLAKSFRQEYKSLGDTINPWQMKAKLQDV